MWYLYIKVQHIYSYFFFIWDQAVGIRYLPIHFWKCIFYALFFAVTAIAARPAWAVEPDSLLFSDKVEERQAAYTTLQQSIAGKLNSTNGGQEKENLLMQQQILARLQELPDSHEQLNTALVFTELAAKESLTWEEFEQFLNRHIKISLEEKENSLDLENSLRQLKTLHSRLIALDSKDSAIPVLQLQYAFKKRKHGLQQQIDTQLKEALEEAKRLYPIVLEQTRIEKRRITREEELLPHCSSNGIGVVASRRRARPCLLPGRRQRRQL